MSVSLSEVIRAARARRAALAGESAGYLVLAIADQIVGAPRVLRSADVELSQDGNVRLSGGQASDPESAERRLRSLLDELLLVASSGNPSLGRASRREATAGLDGLVRELETALIPANRAASRRALSRLERETARAKSEGRLAPELAQPTPAPVPVPVPMPAPVMEAASESPPFVLSPAVIPAVVLEPQAEAVFDAELAFDAERVHDAEPELTDESPTVALAIPAEWEPVDPVADADVEVEVEVEEPSLYESPTRALPVAAIELPDEVRTRPEPVILRASQRPPLPAREPIALAAPEPAPEPIELIEPEAIELAPESTDLRDQAFEPVACLPIVLTPSPVSVLPSYALTPALGTIVGELPVLPSEALDELAAEDHAQRIASCQRASDEDACIEPQLEQSPLSPGVSILPSRKSDVRELVASFTVAGTDSSLELTPAPFTALIR